MLSNTVLAIYRNGCNSNLVYTYCRNAHHLKQLLSHDPITNHSACRLIRSSSQSPIYHILKQSPKESYSRRSDRLLSTHSTRAHQPSPIESKKNQLISKRNHLSTMTIDSKIKKLEQKELIVFDFDDTLVDCNSDTWVHQLSPTKSIPNELQYQSGQDYFRHVQSVLNYLHSVNVTEQDYVTCLGKMPEVPGMIDKLVKGLGQHKDKYDMIILSDANSFFISTFLQSQSISNLFSTILTNPGKFNDNGQLTISEYHIQDYCPISSRNLCKGEALKNYIGKRMLDHNVVYYCINYVGDGENDLCPSTKLSKNDRIFPRKGFALERLCSRLKMDLTDGTGLPEGECETIAKVVANLKAPVIPWANGSDILDVIMNGKSITGRDSDT